MKGKYPVWFAALPLKSQIAVRNLQREREQALSLVNDGEITRDEARKVVARCNSEIARIAEGAA